ncbi:Transmembrane protein [Trema orientale]|uniref:Transmembrane protein n=1 Tax=Trema orientale TaxID=63057 RepID=A0A2P5G1T5_TREOI|nr:Transmembrane protein [Trema orientale]
MSPYCGGAGENGYAAGANRDESGDGNCTHCDRSDRSPPSSSVVYHSDSLPLKDSDLEKLRRIAVASAKGFSIGAGLKGGLALFSILARLRRRKALASLRKEGVITNSEAIVTALKETLRYGLFLGTFAGTFVSVDEIIGSLGGHRRHVPLHLLILWLDLYSFHRIMIMVMSLIWSSLLYRTAKWRALLAGAIAGPSMLLTGLDTQHTSLAIYILMRAAVLASRCGIKSKRFGRYCKPLTWAHGDIFLMCLSSSQILYVLMMVSSVCFVFVFGLIMDAHNGLWALYGIFRSSVSGISEFIFKIRQLPCNYGRESLPPSYKSFLNKHGGKDTAILKAVKEIASGVPFTNLEAVEKYYRTVGMDVKLDPDMKVPCSIVHGNQSCGSHVLSFLIQAYKRALPVYLPVYLIPALIVHRKGLLKRPYTILGKGLLGTARSSLFLSVYCSSAWMWTCILFRIFKRCNIPMVAMGTFPTGLALAIEKKSRRIEISLYCLARAIESFFTCVAEAGYLPQSNNFKRADVVVFSLSTAIIMHCYAQEREVFRSKYLNVLDWVFGVPPPPCETPRCKKLLGTELGTDFGYQDTV